VAEAASRIRTGDLLVVDGVAGVVFVNPDASIEREYERLAADLRASKEPLRDLADLPAQTLDGARITLLANDNKFSDTEAAFLYNADGVGLYRTEFTFAIRSRFPTENEQFELLERAAERMHPRKLALRLVDLGLRSFPNSQPLRDLRRRTLNQLRAVHQQLNPFKFIVYSEWAQAELHPLHITGHL
jgi:phosphoenolpyruvate-protein kinase (PTS system EI component)